jgi:hypothetical protein
MSNAMPKRAAETVSASMVAANPIRPEDLDPDTDEAEAAEE